jgi:hypothetical protein
LQTVIETGIFSSKVSKAWVPSDYKEFIIYIAANPRAGEVVSGSGGVRKIRLSRGNKGKSDGVRIIYFNSSWDAIWLLTLYSKNERKTIPAQELKRIKEAIDAG